MSTFVDEVAEHVRSFNDDLLALEGGHGDSAGLLQSLFRTAHNLKGAARAVDVDAIEAACHGLEDILAGARDGERPLDAEAFRVLFATTDAIQDAGLRLKEAQSHALPVPPAARPSVPTAALPATPAPAAPVFERRDADSLRVSAEKLDTVLARSGELLLAVRQTDRPCSRRMCSQFIVTRRPAPVPHHTGRGKAVHS